MMSPLPDPYSIYSRLRRESPVFAVRSPMGMAHLVTRSDGICGILKNAAIFSSRANGRGAGMVMGRTILEMDGAEHLRHRKVIAAAFLPSALKGAASGTITAIAHALIDEFVRDGRADLV